MGIFRILNGKLKNISRYGLYLGGVYTFFGFFYVQQIKYRLGDSQECSQKIVQNLKSDVKTDDNIQKIILNLLKKLDDIYTFYQRIWCFQQFQRDCKIYKNLIHSILQNYEQLEIFQQKKKMQQEIKKNKIDQKTLQKIIHIRLLNIQLSNLYLNEYHRIVANQINMRTGAILGLSQSQRQKINLIYQYLEKGAPLILKNQKQYQDYQYMKNQVKSHDYNDTIFKLIFI